MSTYNSKVNFIHGGNFSSINNKYHTLVHVKMHHFDKYKLIILLSYLFISS